MSDAGKIFYEEMKEYNRRNPTKMCYGEDGKLCEMPRDFDSALGALLPGAIDENKENAYTTRVIKRKGE